MFNKNVIRKNLIYIVGLFVLFISIGCQPKAAHEVYKTVKPTGPSTSGPVTGGPAAGTHENEVEGGISSGGGGTLPANPISEFDVYDIVKEAKAILRLYYRLENQIAEPLYLDESNNDLYTTHKYFAGKKNLLTIMEETDIEILKDQACKDKNGNEVDASIIASKANSICLSAYRIAPKLIKEIAHKEILALITHEFAHLLGANEDDAVDLQKFTVIRLGRMQLEKISNFFWGIGSDFNAIQSDLVAGIDLVEKDDYAAATKQLMEFNANYYKFISNYFDQFSADNYAPLSYLNYYENEFEYLESLKLNWAINYIQTQIPDFQGQSYAIEEYNQAFGDQKEITFYQLAENTNSKWLKKNYYSKTEKIFKIENKEELLKTLNQHKQFINELGNLVWAVGLNYKVPVLSGPWNKSEVNPWTYFIGTFKANLTNCKTSDSSDLSYIKELKKISFTPIISYPNMIEVKMHYTSANATDYYQNNGIFGIYGSSVTVSGDDMHAIVSSELGNRWDYNTSNSWQKNTNEIKQVGNQLIFSIRTDYLRYQNYKAIEDFRVCEFELIQDLIY